MRTRLASLAALLLAVTLVSAPAEGRAPDLSAALERALAEPGVAPRKTAALAVDLGTGEILFEQNAARALAPASAQKLAVSFAALRALGPGYRFRTQVVASGDLRGSVWHGNLFLVGYGDPTLAKSDLDALASEVAGWGIRRVNGRVFGDEEHFDRRRDAPGWKSSFLGIESSPLSALKVAGTRSRTAEGSAAAAARAFVAALARTGVTVRGKAGRGRAPDDVVPLALDYSEPLTEIVALLNRDSDNFVAEMLLKELGASVVREGTTSAGARVVVAELAAAEIPVAGVRIADGSGLSHLDRLTARTLVALLREAERDPAIRGHFLTSLAVAGVSGTMKRRLVKRPARGRVIAKTGTTSRASSLAGFVRKRYVFAILQNGEPVPYWSARNAQDRFVTILARS